MSSEQRMELTEPVTCSSCGAVSVNGGKLHCHTYYLSRTPAAPTDEEINRDIEWLRNGAREVLRAMLEESASKIAAEFADFVAESARLIGRSTPPTDEGACVPADVQTWGGRQVVAVTDGNLSTPAAEEQTRDCGNELHACGACPPCKREEAERDERDREQAMKRWNLVPAATPASDARAEAHKALDAYLDHSPMKGEECEVNEVLGCGKCERCRWISEHHRLFDAMFDAMGAAAREKEGK